LLTPDLTDEDVRHPELLGVDGVQRGVVSAAVLSRGGGGFLDLVRFFCTGHAAVVPVLFKVCKKNPGIHEGKKNVIVTDDDIRKKIYMKNMLRFGIYILMAVLLQSQYFT
jgi:hypothetical protein